MDFVDYEIVRDALVEVKEKPSVWLSTPEDLPFGMRAAVGVVDGPNADEISKGTIDTVGDICTKESPHLDAFLLRDVQLEFYVGFRGRAQNGRIKFRDQHLHGFVDSFSQGGSTNGSDNGVGERPKCAVIGVGLKAETGHVGEEQLRGDISLTPCVQLDPRFGLPEPLNFELGLKHGNDE